ncbi:tripartite motif-containing protein 65 isoform X3 [Cuculus canorus]|uniref:tripartite motif-containing protein 65 isoform X3 n=1 Tax=Cuculus canorus TaxID=55661 RepID=UPI0023AA5CF8|nr:tripartite motif-containing protein 65 isoform X3 [Cuculus canorus]
MLHGHACAVAPQRRRHTARLRMRTGLHGRHHAVRNACAVAHTAAAMLCGYACALAPHGAALFVSVALGSARATPDTPAHHDPRPEEQTGVFTFEDDGNDLMNALGLDSGLKGDGQQRKKAEDFFPWLLSSIIPIPVVGRMASPALQKLEEKLTCSICLEVFRVPVTLPCGHNFCKHCISGHWHKEELVPTRAQRGYSCPQCRRAFKQRPELDKNVTLCSVTELARDGEVQVLGDKRCEVAYSELCLQHRRPLELYCEDERRCVCCICTVQQCQGHQLVLLEEERSKKQALLKESLEKAQEESERMEQEMQKLEEQTHNIKELPLLLMPESLEARRPVEFDVANVVKPIAEILTNIARLLQVDLQGSVAPKAPDPTSQGPVDPQELTVKVVAPLPRCHLRAELLKDHRNLTFDPKTANKYLELSKGDRKAKHVHSAVCGWQEQGPRFKPWQVLCTQGYGHGHHYWEVKVSSHSVILGVTYRGIPWEWKQGHKFNIGLDEGSWGLQVREDCYLAWHKGQAEKIQEQLYKNLGVRLDYGKGLLSFYGLGERTQLIHSFHNIFTEPLYPVFWLCEGRAVTLCQRD